MKQQSTVILTEGVLKDCHHQTLHSCFHYSDLGVSYTNKTVTFKWTLLFDEQNWKQWIWSKKLTNVALAKTQWQRPAACSSSPVCHSIARIKRLPEKRSPIKKQSVSRPPCECKLGKAGGRCIVYVCVGGKCFCLGHWLRFCWRSPGCGKAEFVFLVIQRETMSCPSL